MNNQKSILIIIAQKDFNEDEYLAVYNKFKKSGIKIFIGSDAENFCFGSNGLKVKNDINFYNINPNNFDCLVFIGGNGIKNYWNNSHLYKIINNFNKKKKIISAICSSVVILANAEVLKNIPATCFPENKNELINKEVDYKELAVVRFQNIITARDPLSSSEFAETILNTILNYK